MNVRRWVKGRRVGVLMGGRSPERPISLRTGRTVLAALKRLGIAACGIDVDRTLPQRLQRHRVAMAFLALHGPGGEDGSVQGLLEVMGIPYTGSGVAASAIALHKDLAKQVFRAAGLPTPGWTVVRRSNGRLGPKRFPLTRWPVVVKPASQGSALGVTIVRTPTELHRGLQRAWRLSPRALVEEYIRGTEVTVGILGDQPLPVIEIIPANAFYDYEAKYVAGKSTHLIPARLPAKILQQVQALGLAAFRAVGAKAVGRVDLLVNRQMAPFVLEVNTIPGMTPTSLLPEAAHAVGISFDELVLKILEYSLADADS